MMIAPERNDAASDSVQADSCRVAFITHYCTHYRVRTYEILAKHLDVTYYFYSAGKEKYWDPSHGVSKGNFRHEYLPGFQIGRTRVALPLVSRLLAANCDVYLKCINGKFALPLTYLIARLRRKPFVLWTGLWLRQRTFMHRLAWPFTRYIYRHADAIVTYGTHVNRFLVNEGVPPARIFAARHAVDNDAYDRTVSEAEKEKLRERLQIRPGQKVILFVGRLAPVKGLSFLLAALAKLPPEADFVLVLAGQGPEEASLRKQAEELGVAGRVRFAGYVRTAETPAYYSISWVHVLPSVTTPLERETWGLVVNEAFNQGLPSIVSDAVGAAAGGLVTENETGFVVPEGDISALASRLRSILSDDGLRHRMAAAASARIAAWDNKAMVEAFRNAVAYATSRTA
jgi:glycosyltransferase involved in cell wall biosynthesis